MPKYIFFDNDNTLTRSRSPITPGMADLLTRLSQKYEVLVISGGSDEKQIRPQLGEELRGKYWSMGQNGNVCIDKTGKMLWENKMSWMQKAEVLSYAHRVHSLQLFPHKDPHDLLEDRGSQISYSFIGHTAKIDEKEKFDPDKTKRTKILEEHPFRSETVEVKIAGTTCFDFYIKGSHKGKNISDLCEKMGWNKDECLYVGDALFKNGNDETVIGVIPIQKVRDPSDTEEVIRELLSSKETAS